MSDINVVEKEVVFKDLVDSYANIFSHYLNFKNIPIDVDADYNKHIIMLIQKVTDVVMFEDESEKEAVNKIIKSLETPYAFTFYDLAMKMGIAGGSAEAPIKKLRVLVYAEIEKSNSNASQEYIKSIM